ncbi:unnamed protein product [Rotaria magnacalcarata]
MHSNCDSRLMELFNPFRCGVELFFSIDYSVSFENQYSTKPTQITDRSIMHSSVHNSLKQLFLPAPYTL